jgi:hypothetical protein
MAAQRPRGALRSLGYSRSGPNKATLALSPLSPKKNGAITLRWPRSSAFLKQSNFRLLPPKLRNLPSSSLASAGDVSTRLGTRLGH